MGSTTQIHTQGASEATASVAHMMTQLRATGLTHRPLRHVRRHSPTYLCTPTAIVPSVLFQKREN
eukprot:2895873-Prymnesium_polylepis.1